MADALQVAHAYFDAWNRRDAAAIVATFAEGGTYHDPIAQELCGEAIGVYARGLWGAFPDLSFEIVGETLVNETQVATQWLMKGTNTGPFRGLPPSGRAIALPGADFITVAGNQIRSVRGYFDAGEVPRQLGLQILVMPYTLGPYQFGSAVSVQSGRKNKPGAFSVTLIQVRSEQEVQDVKDYSRAIAAEMLAMPGFIGWTGIVIGNRLLTVTAWDDAASSERLVREGTHLEAMRRFFGPDFGAALYTSVWRAERVNAMWVRCTECGRVVDYERAAGQCRCGQALPEPPPYW